MTHYRRPVSTTANIRARSKVASSKYTPGPVARKASTSPKNLASFGRNLETARLRVAAARAMPSFAAQKRKHAQKQWRIGDRVPKGPSYWWHKEPSER